MAFYEIYKFAFDYASENGFNAGILLVHDCGRRALSCLAAQRLFRNDLAEVTPNAYRPWQRHSLLPLSIISCITLSTTNFDCEKVKLKQTLSSLGLNQSIPQHYHQRTFGTSRITKI